MEGNGRIGYDVGLDIKVWFQLHCKKDGRKFIVTVDEFNGVKDVNGTTVISYPWDNDGMYFPYDEVTETVDEVKSLYDEAVRKEEELRESLMVLGRVPDSKIWDFCSKTSHEWWRSAMNKWNALSDEEQKKYNQFIGFNDFSDYLMNIMAGAMMKLRDTGRLDYEEGSLVSEEQRKCRPLDIGNCNNVSMIKEKTNEVIFDIQDEEMHKEEFVGVKQSPSETFPRINGFIVGSSYRH